MVNSDASVIAMSAVAFRLVVLLSFAFVVCLRCCLFRLFVVSLVVCVCSLVLSWLLIVLLLCSVIEKCLVYY